MSYETHAPQPGYMDPAPGHAPGAAPARPGGAIGLMYTLLAIGVVSLVVDYVAGSIVVGELGPKAKQLGVEIGMSYFNPGTMYANVVFAIVIGVLGILVGKASNGARITGAILAILFALGGLIGLVIAFIVIGKAGMDGDTIGIDDVVPPWYMSALVLAIAQIVISIIVTVKLFSKKTAAFCTQPK